MKVRIIVDEFDAENKEWLRLADTTIIATNMTPTQAVAWATDALHNCATYALAVEEFEEEEAEEKAPTLYTVTLTYVDENYIGETISQLQDCAKTQMKDAEDAIDGVRAGKPFVIKKGATSSDAIFLSETFKAIGAKIELT